MSRDNFYKNTIILTTSNLVTGILRFVFSMLLSRKLGSEGLGLYGLIMPVYDIFCCITSGGIMTALSKEAAGYLSAKDFKNLNKSVHITIIFEFIWSAFFALLLVFVSPLISNYVVKDSRTLYSLWVIAPAILFISFAAVYKGYFFGISSVKIPAFIDIFEKTIRMLSISALILAINNTNITATVTISYLALTIGEFISFILLFIYYRANKKKLKSTGHHRTENSAQLLFNILAIAAPLCLNAFLTTTLSGFSTLLIPRRLLYAGISYADALSMIGKFSGMALTIVFFPMVIISSISTLLTPDISKSNALGHYRSMEKRTKDVIKISLLIGISNLIICICIPDALGQMFFKVNDIGPYISLAALSAPFIYIFGSTTGILNGLGKQKIVLINSLISAVLEIILFYFLMGIPSINIKGYGITMLITSVISCLLNLYAICKELYLPIGLGEIIIDICLTILTFYFIKILNIVIPNSLFYFKNIAIICVGFTLLFTSLILNRFSQSTKRLSIKRN
ncbi:stage V sporulation protein B [Clostridium collagenovorans DSM 3089]|uniref:Multidrug-efflux transporter n=1 Tax=Clostridium collagenovorans DSM 3089 TaxID=1121306 RepID=A0A1M5TZX1_9CLOT|nr:stage V sporulation protein B [Clostridium collagenovorans]SHH56150.1 stage V sporulation protein B [Clostridium collagenovorans DSM 3089]